MAALYLKYRPQNLEALIGQEAVKKTLLQAMDSGKLSHGYLFVGPRGTGKTSTARIVAKMVNCEVKGESIKGEVPCNKCSTCLSITDGSNLDLIEIDAASNRGIDDIRSLRENIKLSPSGSKKKVYIIDEVHMLTTEAFNALLKTLEEPPAHALFILATTEVNKVPQTILSRVQRLDFKLASVSDLIIALKRIADEEGIKVEADTLKIIAKKGDGSFRDAVKYLDQLASGGEITKELAESLLQSGDFNQLVELLDSLAEKDSKKALSSVLTQIQSVNVKNLIFSTLDLLRSLVFIKNGLETLVEEEYGVEKYEVLKKLADKFTSFALIRALDILQESSEKLKIASIPSLPLELAVVEICNPSTVIASEAKQSSLESNTTKIASSPSSPRNDEGVAIFESSIPINSEKIVDDEKPSVVQSSNSDILKLQEKWNFVLETIRQYNYSLEALLRSVKIASCEGTVVVLEVPYSFHQRILEQPKSRDLLESILSDILERPIRVTTALGQRPQRIEDIANVEVAADDEIISMAADIFQGKLVD
jgi:DNA polymerase III subunit gamma/tau